MNYSRTSLYRAVGIAAICYGIFRGLAWAAYSFAKIAESFAYWVKWSFLPLTEEMAIGLGIAFLIFAAVTRLGRMEFFTFDRRNGHWLRNCLPYFCCCH